VVVLQACSLGALCVEHGQQAHLLEAVGDTVHLDVTQDLQGLEPSASRGHGTFSGHLPVFLDALRQLSRIHAASSSFQDGPHQHRLFACPDNPSPFDGLSVFLAERALTDEFFKARRVVVIGRAVGVADEGGVRGVCLKDLTHGGPHVGDVLGDVSHVGEPVVPDDLGDLVERGPPTGPARHSLQRHPGCSLGNAG